MIWNAVEADAGLAFAPGSDNTGLGTRASPRLSRINTNTAVPEKEKEGQHQTDRDDQLTGSSTAAIDPLSQVSAYAFYNGRPPMLNVSASSLAAEERAGIANRTRF